MYTFFCIFAVRYGRNEICICLWNYEFLVYYLQLPLHEHCIEKFCVFCHHHHKHQGLDSLIRSVSRVTAALANVSLVLQLFSFLVGFMLQFIMEMMEIAITRVGEQIFTLSVDGKLVFQLIFFSSEASPLCFI
jgi:hypothetical protein